VVVRRRDRLRHATLSEIKDLAWAQIAGTGAAALSLRAVARDMGMTSSALYRYFPSRDHLLTALAADGFASLADELEAAEEDGLGQELSPPAQFLHLLRVYRSWSLAHPTEYALMFGTPVPGFDECGPEPKLEMLRGVNVLLRMMVSCVKSGRVVPPPLDPSVERKLAAKLRKWKGHAGEGLPPAALAACMFVWMQLHGAISLELFGHLPPDLLPADELFEQEMRQLLVLLGAGSDA
jgi:AcrR family transcriptional regulator